MVKKKVKLRITTAINEETSVQKSTGELYVKEQAIYVRYAEPHAEMGRTVSTLKLKNDSVKIIRHGDVKMEQLFSQGEITYSLYNTPQGALELEVCTLAVMNRLMTDGMGTFAWKYTLSLDGELAGTYEITLDIQEEK